FSKHDVFDSGGEIYRLEKTRAQTTNFRQTIYSKYCSVTKVIIARIRCVTVPAPRGPDQEKLRNNEIRNQGVGTDGGRGRCMFRVSRSDASLGWRADSDVQSGES